MASFTGHISDLTKEVLMKKTKKEEETPESKRKEAEATQAVLRAENKRLEALCNDLEQVQNIRASNEAANCYLPTQTTAERLRSQTSERKTVLKSKLQKLQSATQSGNSGAGLVPSTPCIAFIGL